MKQWSEEAGRTVASMAAGARLLRRPAAEVEEELDERMEELEKLKEAHQRELARLENAYQLVFQGLETQLEKAHEREMAWLEIMRSRGKEAEDASAERTEEDSS